MKTTLVLNTDGIPVSMLPLSVIPWQESIKYMCLDKAHVLEWYDNWIVHSVNWSTQVPAVIMLKAGTCCDHAQRIHEEEDHCSLQQTERLST